MAKKCKHLWKEDENFKAGAVMMFSGEIENVKQETRIICKKCGAINYIEVDNGI